ncbi:hypothetical protein HPB51_006652 [Rhipicephalus microplus]|uniref:Uncharacterized protein n=1 Tax=Rhipicephalus microplus TaxID=6941 RepID=A0A9J6E7B6_RHIMP|nr:hypothetical protein HPB51_006652 [Rhipicephalus microplus]
MLLNRCVYVPGPQSRDRISKNRSLALASLDASCHILQGGQNNINVPSEMSGGTLYLSLPSNNISGINSPDQQPSHTNQFQCTPSNLKSGQAAQNRRHHRTWAHSQRPGHYSDSSSMYSAFVDHNYGFIDSDASSVNWLSNVLLLPTPRQCDTFYKDLSDVSQHSSSSFVYDQLLLLVVPPLGKYQVTPPVHIMQGFTRDYALSSLETPRYSMDQ